MYLMFDNAWSYNRKTSRVYRYCTKLLEVFEASINDAMQSLGYCCGYRVRPAQWYNVCLYSLVVVVGFCGFHISRSTNGVSSVT